VDGQKVQKSSRTVFLSREIHGEITAPIHGHIMFKNISLESVFHSACNHCRLEN